MASLPCSGCSGIELSQYFKRPRHVNVKGGLVGPSSEATRLCSPNELLATSDTCDFCRLILAALCKSWDPERPLHPEDWLRWVNSRNEVTGIYLYSYLFAWDGQMPESGENDDEVYSIRLAIALRGRSDNNIPFLDRAADLQLISTGSSQVKANPNFCGRMISPFRANIQLARDWLDQCESKHGRLCETGLKDNGGVAYARAVPINLRVIDVKSMSLVTLPEKARYFALSYCWGQSKRHFKTFKSNFAELQQHGSLRRVFSLLPRVIQDSINLVREMGQDYLWIDALCIIQDCQQDKDRQISQMNRVYDGASMTIISAPRTLGNSVAHEGLPGYRTGSRTFRQDTALVQGFQLCTTLIDLEQAVQWSPWSARAWTYQEQALSRRRLYFTETQLYFHCISDIFCEDVIGEEKSPFAHIYPGTSLWNIDELEGEAYSGRALSRSKSTPPRLSLRYYKDMVELYTSRDMSDQGDALIALEGIFSVLRTTMDTEFIHGLPEKFLDDALLWMQRKPHRRRLVPSNGSHGTGFPSWSWAGWINPSDDRTQLRGYVRREVEWYLLTKGNMVFPLQPQHCWDKMDHPFDASKHENLFPRGSLPADFLMKLRPRDQMTKQDRDSCSLVCWTCVATFQLLGNTVDLGNRANNWPHYEAFVISDSKARPVGSIFLEKTWHDAMGRQQQFEFMLMSRSSSAKDMATMDEDLFPTTPWSFVNVMLIKRRSETAERVGVGVVHEIAWSSSATKPTLIRLS